MREKYIDEIVGVWIIFGNHPDGCVDVSNQDGDLFTHVELEKAEQLVKEQSEFRNKVYAILKEH